jgi:hypothetical protein
MTDKANNNVRSEQIAESMKNGASHEQSAISDFVAGLLPSIQQAQDNSNKIRDAISNSGDQILGKVQFVGPDEKGVIDLKTGDTLVRAGDHEILMLKGGGNVVVKPDGSYEIKSKDAVKVSYDKASGSTTIDFGGGRSVTLSDGKISSVDGNGTSAVMFQERKLDRIPREWPNELPPRTLPNKLPRHFEQGEDQRK